MKINLTSVGPSSVDGSYGDNLHRLSKPTEVRRLNPITHARPGHASTPTLTGLATTRSYLSPPPPHHPTPTARPPAPTRLHAVKSAHQQPRSNYSPAWSAPPRHHLLYSWCLVELLHALAVLSPWCAASCAFHSLSLSLTRASHTCHYCLVGARGQPHHLLCLGCHPTAAAQPVPDPCTASSATNPDTIGWHHQPQRRWSPPDPARPPLAAPQPDSLHRPAPDAARLP
jgi:hypothetical protein